MIDVLLVLLAALFVVLVIHMLIRWATEDQPTDEDES